MIGNTFLSPSLHHQAIFPGEGRALTLNQEAGLWYSLGWPFTPSGLSSHFGEVGRIICSSLLLVQFISNTQHTFIVFCTDYRGDLLHDRSHEVDLFSGFKELTLC